MQRRDDDARPEAYPLRAGGHRGQHGQRLRQVAVIEAVVLGDPERVDAKAFGFLVHLEHEAVQPRGLYVPLRRIAHVEVEADVHRSASDVVAEQIAVGSSPALPA